MRDENRCVSVLGIMLRIQMKSKWLRALSAFTYLFISSMLSTFLYIYEYQNFLYKNSLELLGFGSGADYQAMYQVMRQTYAFFVFLLLFLAGVGILSIEFLKKQQEKRDLYILKALGLSRRKYISIVFVQTMLVSLVYTAAGGVLGCLIFSQVIKIMKLKEEILSAPVICNTLPKIFLLIFLLILFSQILPLKMNKGRRFVLLGISMAVFSLTVTFIMNTVNMLLPMIVSLLLIGGIYLLTKAVLKGLDNRENKLQGTWNLGWRLMLYRKEKNAMITAALILGLLVFLCVYNVQFGLAAALEKSWIHNQGFNAAVECHENSNDQFHQQLKKSAIPFTQLYTKEINNSYYMGIVKNNRVVTEKLEVEKGTLKADPYFLGLTDQEFGENFALDNGVILRLAADIPNFAMSPVSYTILMNYEDGEGLLDDTFYETDLVHVNASQLKDLKELCAKYDLKVITAQSLIDELKSGLKNYFLLLTATGFMLIAAITLLLLNMTYVIVYTRRYELANLYILGGGPKKLRTIILSENLSTGFIGFLISMILTVGFINLFFYLYTGTISYRISIMGAASLFLCMVLYISLLTLGITRLIDWKGVCEILQHSDEEIQENMENT